MGRSRGRRGAPMFGDVIRENHSDGAAAPYRSRLTRERPTRKSIRAIRNAAKWNVPGDPNIATLKLGASLPRRQSRGALLRTPSSRISRARRTRVRRCALPLFGRERLARCQSLAQVRRRKGGHAPARRTLPAFAAAKASPFQTIAVELTLRIRFRCDILYIGAAGGIS